MSCSEECKSKMVKALNESIEVNHIDLNDSSRYCTITIENEGFEKNNENR